MADDKANKIIALLKNEYPAVKIALHYSNPLELLISTILSAQCTDKQVNEVTKKLFVKYVTPQDFIGISQEELEKAIYSTGFYRSKAKNIIGACKIIASDYNSKVPDNMEELIKLPGVGRKTANIVLSGAFGKLEGMAVDTHVKRLSGRLGLTEHTDPEKIEKDLLKIIPKNDWDLFSLLLINHGRKVCAARKPLCGECILDKLCISAFTFGTLKSSE
jgi:endonuclease-3